MTNQAEQSAGNEPSRSITEPGAAGPRHAGFGPRPTIALAVGLFVLAMWPLAVFVHLGTQDYPNHLARAHVLTHLDDPIFAAHFRSAWSLVPNLAFDVFMVAVAGLMDVWNAGRLFVAVSAALTVAGVMMLAKVLRGSIGVPQLLAIPLLFTTGFAKGFLAFDFAMGLMLVAAAAWEAIGDERRGLRLFVGSVFSVLLYLSHLAGFGAYGLWVIGARLRDLGALRRPGALRRRLIDALWDGVQILPVVVLFAIERATVTEVAVTETRARGFQAPWNRLGQIERLQDLGPMWLDVSLLGVLIGLLLFALITGRIKVDRRVLPAVGAALVLFFAMPNSFGGVHIAAWRPLLAAALFFTAGLIPTATFDRTTAIAVTAIFAVAVTVASATTALSWSATERAYADLSRVLEGVPPGSRIFYIQTHSTLDERGRRARSGLYHLASYATIDRRLIVQSAFVMPGQQPLRFRDPVLQTAPESSRTFLHEIRRNFAKYDADIALYFRHLDHVVSVGDVDPRRLDPMPDRDMIPVAQAGEFRLFELRHAAEPSPTAPTP